MSVLPSFFSPSLLRPGWKARTQRGLTLIEVMVAAGVLVITSVSGYSGFLLLNRRAANMRNLSMARALCQERIEQALTLPYSPNPPKPASPTFPAAPSADPSHTAAYMLLGSASNYSGSTYNGGADLQTSLEKISIYTRSEFNSTTGGSTVDYTRTTKVSPSGLTAYATAPATGSALNTLLFTVSVSWTFRGSTYSTSMSTLRSQD